MGRLTLSRRDLLAALALQPAIRNEPYFRIDGKPKFLLGKNVTGWLPDHFAPLFDWARESGDELARIHLDHGVAGAPAPGEADDRWARRWETVFDMATAHGIYVIPVFGIWGQWNDGSKGEPWHFWDKNPYRKIADRPAELFEDTRCRRLWLEWLGKLVSRWQARRNILAWEIFSELDLVTGSTEQAAVDFAGHAARIIRGADEGKRPVTASLSGVLDWPALLASNAIDLVSVHPYPRGGNLDEVIVSSVRERLKRYGKPVLLGECGLDARPPVKSLAASERAAWGIRHAIWASAVSGAMNGRMLWWEDGYDLYYPEINLREKYRHASQPVARFLKDVDYRGFRPIEAVTGSEIWGAAIGSERIALAWFRDARSTPPAWPVRRLERQSVNLTMPGNPARCNVVFYDPGSGDETGRLRCPSGRVPLPPFEDSIALKMFPLG